MRARPFLPFLFAVVPTLAQNQTSTQEVWILDHGAAQIVVVNGAFDPVALQTIPLGGLGSARSLSFDAAGKAFVCRGDEVRTYDGSTAPSVVFADATDGLVQAQDVAVRPGAGGDVYVACGISVADSKIVRFNAAGVVQATLTSNLIEHPRRLAWSADGTKLYVASVGNRRIVEYDVAANTFAQTFSLAGQNVIPVGLDFDVVRGGLWIVGDWGQTGSGVGFLQLTPAPATYFSVITPTTTAGLTAPSSVAFDRFRNLVVGSRNVNSGVAGVYVYEAGSGNMATFERSVTGLGLQSVIDVAPRPEIVGFTAPVDPNDPTQFVINASLSVAVPNPLQFRAPRAAGSVYYAAMSLMWPVDCAPYVPGLIDPALRILGPDPRGVPLLPDYFFRQTAAVCCLGQSPPLGLPADPPLAPFLKVLGFGGILNAAGEAPAALNFAAGIPLAADGAVFSIAFVVIDPAVSSLFGRISDAFCVTAKVVP